MVDLPIPNRVVAGQLLAEQLTEYRDRADVILLALPRGGVPTAYEIADSLNLKLDLVIVRKLGVPFQPELACGAIASGGIRALNQDVIEAYNLSDQDIAAIEKTERLELQRRDRTYRGERPYPDLKDKCVILVDDGIATGATMLAAIDAIRQQQVADIVVAVAVAPAETVARLKETADQVICLATPEPFFAIGSWYRDFGQTSDAEVMDLLQRAWQRDIEQSQATSTSTP